MNSIIFFSVIISLFHLHHLHSGPDKKTKLPQGLVCYFVYNLEKIHVDGVWRLYWNVFQMIN